MRESGRKKKKKKTKSVEWQACTNRLIPSLPLKTYPLLRIKEFIWAQAIQACSLKVNNFYSKRCYPR